MNHITLSLSAVALDAHRKVQGIAYTGSVLRYGDQRIAIDLASLQIDPARQIPLLHNHDRDRLVGYAYLSVRDGALHIDGELLNTDDAQVITRAADGGLHWQLSVHVESGSVSEQQAGSVINGRTITDPALLFARGIIREVSFTPTGVDADTTVVILSLSYQGATMTTAQQPSSPQPTTPQPTTPPPTAPTPEGPAQPVVYNEQDEQETLEQQVAALSQQLADREQRIAELEQAQRDQQQQQAAHRLTELGASAEHADTIAAGTTPAALEAVCAQLSLTRMQHLALSTSYADPTPNKRDNPLIKAIQGETHG